MFCLKLRSCKLLNQFQYNTQQHQIQQFCFFVHEYTDIVFFLFKGTYQPLLSLLLNNRKVEYLDKIIPKMQDDDIFLNSSLQASTAFFFFLANMKK